MNEDEKAVNDQYLKVCAAWSAVQEAECVAEEKRGQWKIEAKKLNKLMNSKEKR